MNALVAYNVTDMERIARALATSKLFGIQNAEQALALCLIAQAEGRHPASAAQDYHIIQNRPAKKADAMLRDFIASGGKVQWHALDDEKASATFSHPSGGTAKIDWDMKRAQTAGISSPMWKKFPRQMLRARTVSEGVRTIYPMATSGMYVPEEVQDFDAPPQHVSRQDVSEPQNAVVIESEKAALPPPKQAPLSERASAVEGAFKAAQTLEKLNKAYKLASGVFAQLDTADPERLAELEALFKARESEIVEAMEQEAA